MKLMKKEDRSVYTSILQRRVEGVIETKCGAETEEMSLQRLPYLGIHPIYNHQTQTLLHMPVRFC